MKSTTKVMMVRLQHKKCCSHLIYNAKKGGKRFQMKKAIVKFWSLFLVLVLLFSNALSSISHAKEIISKDESLDICITTNSDWESGYLTEIVVTNRGDESISEWNFDLRVDGTITSYWNTVIEEISEGEYAFHNTTWNGALSPGETVNVGYVVDRKLCSENENESSDTDSVVEEENNTEQITSETQDAIEDDSEDKISEDNEEDGTDSNDENVDGEKNEMESNSEKQDMDSDGESDNQVDDLPDEKELKKVFVDPFCEIYYEVTGYWEGGYNVVIKIKNTSENPIKNWILEMDSTDEMVDLYNAQVFENENGKKSICGQNWNQDIESNKEVRFGYTVRTEYVEPPKMCHVYSLSDLVDDNLFETEFYREPIWDNGFTGYLILKNTSDEEIIDWTLEFEFEEEIDELWNACILEHEGHQYVITNAGYSKNILPNDQIVIGFNVRNSRGNYSPHTFSMLRYVYTLPTQNTILSMDADGDGLSDFYEEHITFTDPQKIMTDGINMDGERDEDQDGLSNLEEFALLSNAMITDTDYDGLSDFDEVKIYFTNPCEYDTDFDGVGDWTEVMRGTDPLNTDSNDDGIPDGEEIITFPLCDNQYIALDPLEMGYSVSIEITGKGDFNNRLSLESGIQDDSFPELPYLLGEPLFIRHNEIDFQNATITFTLSDDLLALCPISNIGIASFNEETHQIEFCDTNVVASNQIQCNTNHFSYYFPIDLQKLKLYFAVESIDSQMTMCDVSFVIDTTGSMGSGIYNTKNTISKIAGLTKELNMDVRYGLVEFKDLTEDGFSAKDYGWFNNTDEFKSQLENLCAEGGGDWEESAVDALETARISNFREYSNKSIVLITDAPYKNYTSYDNLSSMEEEIRRLNLSGITVYVITETECMNLYNSLTTSTNGREYDIYADYSVSLIEMFTNENNKAKEYTWVRLANGTVVKLLVNPELATRDDQTDTDSDGVPDMKELTIKTQIACGGERYTIWGFNTNPAIHNVMGKEKLIDAKDDKRKNSAITVYEFYDEVKQIESVFASNFLFYMAVQKGEIIGDIDYKELSRYFQFRSNSEVLYFLQEKDFGYMPWPYLAGQGDSNKRKETIGSLKISAEDVELLEKAGDVAIFKTKENENIKKYRQAYIIDCITGELVGVPHFAASCCAHFVQSANVGIWPIELTSWGGDLQTFSVDLFNEYSEKDYQETAYSFSMLFAKEYGSSSFAMEDLIADVDAVNISAMLDDRLLSKSINEYYVNLAVCNRYSLFLEHYGSSFDSVLDSILPVDAFSHPVSSYSEEMILSSKIPFVYAQFVKNTRIHKTNRLPKPAEIVALKDCFREYIMGECIKEQN